MGQKVEIVKRVDSVLEWLDEMNNTVGIQGEIVDTVYQDGINGYKVEFVTDDCKIDWWWYPEASLKAV